MVLGEWFIIITIVISLRECHKLDDYIHDFEPLNYDVTDFHHNHQRVKRSLESHLYLKFKAFNRNFNLKLKQDDTIFSKHHRHRNNDGSESYIDTSFIYHGHLTDIPTSYAHISVVNGTARGFINIPGDTTYHIDPSEQYIQNPTYHSVIYSEKHMDLDPYKNRREAEKLAGSCAFESNKKWMTETAESAIDRPNRANVHAFNEDYNKYSEASNKEYLKRVKRKSLQTRNTCYLYLRSDPMLWEYIKKTKFNKELSDERVKEEIIAFFTSHVAAIKEIYSRTEFATYDNGIVWTGVNFLVQRTSIMTTNGEKCGTLAATQFCNRNIDVSNFLNLNSLDNHDEFCLAYVFTFRDFTQGTLGLAWVGAETRAAGGICEKFKSYPEGGIQVHKSLNTGIVTIVNYGKKVPSRVSHLTFAHEVGHNFGSPHDSGSVCAPYGTNNPVAADGNYIMFASATMGDKKNNDYFSICSKDNISRVLDAVVNERFKKKNCFNKTTAAFCGNGLVEGDEECDCGYVKDCTDSCCNAKGSPAGTASECKRKPGTLCSPTAGPCCNTDCNFLNVSEICRSSDDCTKESFCQGNNAACPRAEQQPNKTFCNSKSQVCLEGECRGSVCLRIHWDECFLTASDDDNGPSKEELCFIACKNPTTGECISSKNKDALTKSQNIKFSGLLKNISNGSNQESNSGVQLPAGSPCDNFRGYCDVFHRCRGVDAEGPLARLKNLIFNPQTLQTIREWIEEHWWAVLLMAVGLVVVMGVFIKICAVHTPSSNPRKSAARKLTLPRRHQGERGRNKPSSRSATNTNFVEPPPPYTGPSMGGPAHGKGPRYNNGGKRRRDLETQNL